MTRGPSAPRPARIAASVSRLHPAVGGVGDVARATTTPSTRAASAVSGHGTASGGSASASGRGRRAGRRCGGADRLAAGIGTVQAAAACGSPIVASAARHSGHGAGGHLLQRHDVGLARGQRRRLLRQPRDAAVDVPGDEPHIARMRSATACGASSGRKWPAPSTTSISPGSPRRTRGTARGCRSAASPASSGAAAYAPGAQLAHEEVAVELRRGVGGAARAARRRRCPPPRASTGGRRGGRCAASRARSGRRGSTRSPMNGAASGSW